MKVTVDVRAKRIDWPEVVLDLRRAGMSHREIAAECDANGHDWVHRLLNICGVQPRFHQGAKLLGLWMERTGKDAEAVPRR